MRSAENHKAAGQGSHTKLYRDWLIIDVCWLLFACGLCVAFGAAFAVIAILGAYLFGYQTGQESEA